jgi:hypothetical protein
MLAQRADAKSDVLLERDAEFFGAFAYIFAGDAFGEEFVFHAALH